MILNAEKIDCLEQKYNVKVLPSEIHGKRWKNIGYSDNKLPLGRCERVQISESLGYIIYGWDHLDEVSRVRLVTELGISMRKEHGVERYSREDIVRMLSATDPDEIEALRKEAEKVLLETCGSQVFYRGLIEFSNLCVSDCLYCGIRKSNHDVNRYTLSIEQIVDAALWCAEQGYGSVVLQSGERRDTQFVEFVINAVSEIKRRSRSGTLPEGLGITLCVGEQSAETYRRFYDAGAHRYLLRIETTNEKLFSEIHPPSQSLESRKKCLVALRDIGFQVGTGVMIGIPGQTLENLADDVLFFKNMDIDMIGMGPYIVHNKTPMNVFASEIGSRKEEVYSLALKMIAVCRLVLRDVNIAATTALQAIKHEGREEGLTFGANIIMPQLTPTGVRKEYLLYEGKPCVDEDAVQCKGCLERRIKSVGRTVGYNGWGDSVHVKGRKGKGC